MTYALLIGCFVLMGSAAGWAGQEGQGPVGMALCAVLGFATAALFAYRRKHAEPTSRPWTAMPLWGLTLAVSLYAAGAALSAANDLFLYSNLYLGTQRIIEKSLFGIALGLGLGLIVAAHVRRPNRRWGRIVRLLVITGWLTAALVGGVYYVLRTGVLDRNVYPPREESPYLLPWPGGVTWNCGQGNWGIVTHRDKGCYSWDFPMPIGSPICAARDGEVILVMDQNDGSVNPLLSNDMGKNPGNGIQIRHADGTIAVYWHIRKGGARVTKGQRVKQGDVIAESGNVGYTTSPHLHFSVYSSNYMDFRSIPISFRDVDFLGGIPRLGLRYTSGNRPLPSERDNLSRPR
jgi:hypothetical protein